MLDVDKSREELLAELKTVRAQLAVLQTPAIATLDHRQLLEAYGAVTWSADPVTLHFTSISAQIEPLVGFPARQWLAAPDFVAARLHPADRETTLAARQRAVAEQQPCRLQYRLLGAAGQVVFIREQVVPQVVAGRVVLLQGMMFDITREQQQSDDLRSNAERYRWMARSDMIGFFCWDLGGEIFEANDYFLRMVMSDRAALDRGELHWTDLTPPELRHLDLRAIAELMVTGECTPYEKEYLLPNGRRVPILLGAALLSDFPDRGVAFVLDMTELRQAEAAGRESAALFTAFMDNNPTMAWLKREDGEYVYGNAAWTAMFAKSTQVAKSTDYDHFPEATARKLREHDRIVAESGQPAEFVEQALTAAGDLRSWQVIKFPFKDVQGRKFIAGTAVDITARLQAKEELRASERRFRALLENSSESILSMDPAGKLLYVSPSTTRLLGYSAQELLGTSAVRLVHPDDQAAAQAALARVLEQPHETVTFALRVRHQNGAYHWFESVVTNLLQEESVHGIVANFRDVTERYLAEARLRLFESAVEYGDDAVVITDAAPPPRGARIVYVNAGFTRMTGYQREETLGRSPRFLYGPETDLREVERVRALLESREPVSLEIVNYRKDGTPRWIEMNITPLLDQAGKISHFVSIQRDVTERRTAEEALRNSSKQLAEAQRLAKIGNWNRELTTNEVTWSEELYRIFALDSQAIVQHFDDFLEHVHPDDRAAVCETVATSVALGRDFEHLYRIQTPAGERVLHERGTLVFDAYGRAVRLFGTAQDVTEQRRAEAALQQSEERLNLALTAAGMGTWEWNVATGETTYSEHVQSIFGFQPAEPHSTIQLLLERVHADDRALLYEALNRTLEDPTRNDRFECEARVIRPDGQVRWASAKGQMFRNAARRPMRMLGTVMDVTSRKVVELALLRKEAGLRRAQELAQLGSYELHLGLGDDHWSDEIYQILGLAVGQPLSLDEFIHRHVHSDDQTRVRQEVAQALEKASPYNLEYRVVRADGNIRYVRSSGEVQRNPAGQITGLVGTLLDLTERRHLEAQLLQAQKMDAVGRLAGGIAHDFNNLLTVIGGYCEILLAATPVEQRAHGMLDEIRKSSERASDLTRQLLAFSRKTVLAPVVLDLNALVTDSEKLLRRLIGEDVDLVCQLEPELGRVKADPGQLVQVIMNLVVNARDAMPTGGRLLIETQNVELSPEEVAERPEMRPGAYALLSVTDTGSGMDEHTLAHLFEPFFTTKEVGKGTGLGLAVVFGIITQSDGHIEVHSELGHGSTFRLYLPRTSHELMSVPTTAQTISALPRGTETVLLAEDEEGLRQLARTVLESYGYFVLEARDGQEALKIGLEYQGNIDLLVTDVVMPRMSGRELATRLLLNYPNLKVLYASGYTADAVVRHGVREGETAFLKKPFSLQTFALKVREVLDS